MGSFVPEAYIYKRYRNLTGFLCLQRFRQIHQLPGFISGLIIRLIITYTGSKSLLKIIKTFEGQLNVKNKSDAPPSITQNPTAPINMRDIVLSDHLSAQRVAREK